MIQIEIRTHWTIPKGLKKGLEVLEMREQDETIQISVLLR